jgi:hypothetical protein
MPNTKSVENIFWRAFRQLDAFALEEGSPATIGLMRIAFGLLASAQLICYLLRFDIWFSTAGWLNSKCMNLSFTPYVSLLNGTRDDTAILIFLVLVLVASICMTLGLFSRVSTMVTWIGLLSIQNRIVSINYGGDYVIQLMLLYLCFAQTGAQYSVDRLLNKFAPRTPPPVSLWPQKLMQIQIALMYFSAFTYKLFDPCWTQGFALYYALQYKDYRNFWLPDIFRNPPITTTMTYLSTATEGVLSVLPFIRRYRTPVLLVGVLFHLSISYSMRIPFFGPACVCSYLAFFKGEEVSGFLNRLWMKFRLAHGLRTRAYARLSIGLALFFWASTAMAEKLESMTVYSPVFKIDKIYKSMQGPFASQNVDLSDGRPPELLWIRGFRVEVVAPDGKTPMSATYMCHVTLDIDANKHKKLFGQREENPITRLFLLSQGQLSAEFPKGFGVPVMSNEPLFLGTQALNLNDPHPNAEVRYKLTFEFIRDRDLKEPMKPLFNSGASGMKLLQGSDGHWGMTDGDSAKHGPSCLLGMHAANAGTGNIFDDGFGRRFTAHWTVKPGREVNHFNITKFLNLPFDTTVHYALAHLHPYAESLELRDVTTGRRVFKCRAKNFTDKIGLSQVADFSSRRGAPLLKNHDYEFISIYNNTSGMDQDAMVGVVMFLLDKEYKRPLVAEATQNPPH